MKVEHEENRALQPQERLTIMRFLCLYRPGTVESDKPPAQEEMAAMGKLIDEMTKAGVLLAAEGCLPSSKGVRLHIDSGKFSVTDGPFPETKELIAGFCLLQVKSKAEALEWTKRFLAVVGEGTSEIRLLHDQPAA
ncbi:MAG TPA: YciI family protein [Polyangiaceae bacterium]|nr:YciI family protein [Polyangiaceae bacterium]